MAPFRLKRELYDATKYSSYGPRQPQPNDRFPPTSRNEQNAVIRPNSLHSHQKNRAIPTPGAPPSDHISCGAVELGNF